MTGYLLDTQCLLWAWNDDPRLSATARAILLDNATSLHVSMASYWEICQKLALGKLRLIADWARGLDRFLADNRIHYLPIERHHCQAVIELPPYHDDPIDHLLIAQAQTEDLQLLSADARFADYAVPVIW